MNMQLEFNWYLVKQGEPQKLEDGVFDEAGNFLQTGTYYQMHKDGARIYPIGAVVPLIEDDEAIAVIYIRECSQRLGAKREPFTVIHYEVIMDLTNGHEAVQHHYTDMYLAYKKKQEIEDHGGRFKTQDFVNALNRRGFEFALKNREETE